MNKFRIISRIVTGTIVIVTLSIFVFWLFYSAIIEKERSAQVVVFLLAVIFFVLWGIWAWTTEEDLGPPEYPDEV
jgi:amino acid permease